MYQGHGIQKPVYTTTLRNREGYYEYTRGVCSYV